MIALGETSGRDHAINKSGPFSSPHRRLDVV
jgi:hypothetical protein